MEQRPNPVFCSAAAHFVAAEADGSRRFKATAYSGGVVTDHPRYDRVAIDLESTQFDAPAPALYGHDEPVGVIELAAVKNDIKIEGKLFSDLDGQAKTIATMADRGMPWQMSVGVWPGRVESVKAGAKIKLNGRTLSGPLTVFRDNRIRETSFVALGADDKTRAQVFELGNKAEGNLMETISKEEHDRIVAGLNDQIKASGDSLKALQDQFSALQATAKQERDARRLDAVKALFTAIRREFKDDAAKPYLEMSDEAFAAVAKDMRDSAKALDPALFSEHATGGASGDGSLPGDIVAKAQDFIKSQRDRGGREFSVADAVAHVTGRIKLV